MGLGEMGLGEMGQNQPMSSKCWKKVFARHNNRRPLVYMYCGGSETELSVKSVFASYTFDILRTDERCQSIR